MMDASRDDDALRRFLAARNGGFFETRSEEDEHTRARDEFLAIARERMVPVVQQRLLAEIGVMTDARGIELTAVEVIEDESWGKHRTWLLVGPAPWSQLTDLVVRRIRRSYRASVPRTRESTLTKIAAASLGD